MSLCPVTLGEEDVLAFASVNRDSRVPFLICMWQNYLWLFLFGKIHLYFSSFSVLKIFHDIKYFGFTWNSVWFLLRKLYFCLYFLLLGQVWLLLCSWVWSILISLIFIPLHPTSADLIPVSFFPETPSTYCSSTWILLISWGEGVCRLFWEQRTDIFYIFLIVFQLIFCNSGITVGQSLAFLQLENVSGGHPERWVFLGSCLLGMCAADPIWWWQSYHFSFLTFLVFFPL